MFLVLIDTDTDTEKSNLLRIKQSGVLWSGCVYEKLKVGSYYNC